MKFKIAVITATVILMSGCSLTKNDGSDTTTSDVEKPKATRSDTPTDSTSVYVQTPADQVQQTEHDGAPSPLDHYDPSLIADAVPSPEPILPRGNVSPYTVMGKTYEIMPTAKGYKTKGIASWYGTKFHGRLTSNGEKYDLYAMTAAHKTLPIPTYVKVTNLQNNRQVIVRVNDRGPFHQDRVIDLSYAAAVKLGYEKQGTAPVALEAITFDENTVNRVHYLQAGAFSTLDAAVRQSNKVEAQTSHPVSILVGDDNLYRVHIGPLIWEELSKLKRDLLKVNIKTAVSSLNIQS